MNKLKEIQAFVGVTEAGSLTAAALREKVTPVMMGRRIDALEKRLGVKLLHRSTRRLAVTQQGVVFLDHCRKLLADLEEAERLVSEGGRKVTGHLVVSTPAAFGREHVAPHASAFVAENPELRISFNLTDRVVDLAREGYDLGVRIGGEIDPSFVAVKLADNRRVVCATPGYLKRCGRPLTLDELADHNCLAFNLQGGQQQGWYFQRNGKHVIIRVSGNLDCNDGELLHRWSLEGLGLAWRSTWEIQRELSSGDLVTVLDEFALPGYDIMAVYPQQRHVPAKVRLFVDMLGKTYAQPGYWEGRVAAPLTVGS
jgi:DNA-binding transcriptional LysR family regulator